MSDKGSLIWSFASLENMDLAVAAIRQAYPAAPVTYLRGCIDGNVYWHGPKADSATAVLHVSGICRGVAFATRDASL